MSLPASVWHQVQCSRPLAPCTANRGQAYRRYTIGGAWNCTLVASATAAAAGANSSGPVSTTAWPMVDSAEASVLDQGPRQQAQQHTTVGQNRRRRKMTLSFTNTEAEVALDKAQQQTAQQHQQQPLQQHERKQVKHRIRPVDADTLVSRTQLSQTAAQKIVAAKASGYGVPKETSKLCSNVQHLQQMLGVEYADLALRRFPSLVAYSPATLAFNMRQWQAFFGTNDPPGISSSPLARQLLETRQAALLRKIARQPQLLGVSVEKQVANLYDIGVILGEQDMHTFAYKAMDLGTKGADRLQDKLLRVLDVLNSKQYDQQQHEHQPLPPLQQILQQQPEQQQPEQQQPEQQQLEQELIQHQQLEQQQLGQQLQQLPQQEHEDHNFMQLTDETAAGSSTVHLFTLSDVQAAGRGAPQQQHEEHDAMQPAAEAAAGSSTVHHFTLSEVQAAARVDPQWLSLAADTLEARLIGIQQALQIPMSAVGLMFLRNPSLLNKRPATLAVKAAALRNLPGLQQGYAAAMMAAMPSLLNLDPDKLASRWQRLQQAADSHPSWRIALDSKSPCSLANLLIRSEARYQRVPAVIAARLQEVLPLAVVLNKSDSDFERRAAKARAVLQRRAVLQGDAPSGPAAAAVRSIPQPQQQHAAHRQQQQ